MEKYLRFKEIVNKPLDEMKAKFRVQSVAGLQQGPKLVGFSILVSFQKRLRRLQEEPFISMAIRILSQGNISQ